MRATWAQTFVTIVLMLGAILSAWVSLKTDLADVMARQAAFEQSETDTRQRLERIEGMMMRRTP